MSMIDDYGLYTIEEFLELDFAPIDIVSHKMAANIENLNESLEDKIIQTSNEKGIPATLQHFVAYHYLCEGLNIREIREMFAGYGVNLDAKRTSKYVKRMKIPIRTSAQTNRLSFNKSRILPESGLSNRQLEVLVCISRGHSNEEIADLLGINYHTIKNHAHAIYHALSIENPDFRTKAVFHYFSKGWNKNLEIGTQFAHIPYKEKLRISSDSLVH